MHYNSPRFFLELKNASIPRFVQAVGYSFGLSGIFYIVIAATGYLTFGGNSASYILNNYSANDPLATASRLAVGFSTLLTYPLAFFGVRDGCLDILQVPQHLQTKANLNVFTIVLLTILTIVPILIDDLGVINAVGGGCLATLLCFVFPALMYRQAIRNLPRKNLGQEVEVVFAMILMVIGVMLGIVGVYETVAQYNAGNAR
jgi:amino acid permease